MGTRACSHLQRGFIRSAQACGMVCFRGKADNPAQSPGLVQRSVACPVGEASERVSSMPKNDPGDGR